MQQLLRKVFHGCQLKKHNAVIFDTVAAVYDGRTEINVKTLIFKGGDQKQELRQNSTGKRW